MKLSLPALLLIFLTATPIAAKGGSSSSGGGGGRGSSSKAVKKTTKAAGGGSKDNGPQTFEEYTESGDYDEYHNGGAHLAFKPTGPGSMGNITGYRSTTYNRADAAKLFSGTWTNTNFGWNISYALAEDENKNGTVICLCQVAVPCGCGPQGWEEVAGFDGGGEKTMREYGTNLFVVNGTADGEDLKEETKQRTKWEDKHVRASKGKDTSAGSRQGSPTGKMAGGAMMLALLVGAAL